MTFSIVACDLSQKSWGVAVASKFPAVGAVVPWARAEAGAVATQSYANTAFGPRGLALMADGLSAEAALTTLLEGDPERELRQIGLVDARGQGASFTGSGCYDWAGGVAGDTYAIQGNILAGEQVVRSMERVYLETKAEELPARLHAALLAGDRAGGDRRGRQSAAIYVVKPAGGYGGHNDRWLDYRVDDAEDPVPRLGELLELHGLYFGKSPESERVTLAGETLRRLRSILKHQQYLKSESAGEYDELTRAALTAFVGNENFEERADPAQGWIDRPVLEFLFRKFEAQSNTKDSKDHAAGP